MIITTSDLARIRSEWHFQHPFASVWSPLGACNSADGAKAQFRVRGETRFVDHANKPTSTLLCPAKSRSRDYQLYSTPLPNRHAPGNFRRFLLACTTCLLLQTSRSVPTSSRSGARIGGITRRYARVLTRLAWPHANSDHRPRCVRACRFQCHRSAVGEWRQCLSHTRIFGTWGPGPLCCEWL